ncbi:unnamed protein product, partial [marine sediment metagenome]
DEKKREIIQDLMGLTPAEQESLFKSIFLNEDENSST